MPSSCLSVLLFLYHIIRIYSATEQHPVSCEGLADGEHYIRPIAFASADRNPDDLPSILVRCSDGWIILDYSLDSDIAAYFSSFMSITDEFGSMNVGQERLNWPEWLVLDDVQFTTSEDCASCAIVDDDDNETGYYMTGNYYGCLFATKAICDMDSATLECSTCSMPSLEGEDDSEYPGLCTHIVLDLYDSDINSAQTSHQTCVTWRWNYLPSIGLNGQYCPCIRPASTSSSSSSAEMVDAKYSENAAAGKDEDEEKGLDCSRRVVELTNADFASGTYRIRDCGVYRLVEDIALDMNSAPFDDDDDDMGESFEHINDETGFWWPTPQQMADAAQYPSDNFIGAYAMGFFAGIAVEHADVTIDLNGHSFAMAPSFYIQQRFFSLIELASKPFVSGQGPSNFGNADVVYAENVEIMNGVFGLTSHHAIHGNNNRNIWIHDVQFTDFEVSAISMNGFDGVRVEDIEVGPNQQRIPVTPQYAHGRFMLQRMALIPGLFDEDASVSPRVLINGFQVSALQIYDTLQQEMDDAFRYSYQYLTADNADDADAVEVDFDNLFVNRDGLSEGGTLYGLFFNSEGASVFGLGLSPGTSTNLSLRNIHVHSLRARPTETVRAKLQRGPFNDLWDVQRVLAPDGSGRYHGTSYSNAQYAVSELIPDEWWSVLGHTHLSKAVQKWISGQVSQLTAKYGCNADIMLHLTKGIFAVRIDNVRNVELDGDIQIDGLHNLGELGESNLCGAYFSSKNGGHHNQEYPMQIGYTGTEVHGITLIGSSARVTRNANIRINDLLSARGSVYGLNFYADSEVEIEAEAAITVRNVYAGAYLESSEVAHLRHTLLPNTVPRACVMDVWTTKDVADVLRVDEKAQLAVQCVTKFDECSFRYSQIDEAFSAENDVLNFDYMADMIAGDDECMALVEEDEDVFGEDGSQVLLRLSKDSKLHARTLQLLRLQERDTEQIVEDVKDGNNEYMTMYLVAWISVSLMTICFWKLKNVKSMKPTYSRDENTPLIA